MDSDNIPEYTRAELEDFVEASSKFNREALLGAAIVFVASLAIFFLALWGSFLLVVEPESRIYTAIGIGVAMVIAAASYWGYVLIPRIEWLTNQLRGVGQRVYDCQQKLDDIET